MGIQGVVIGNGTMEYVGEDEGRGAVANNDGINIGWKRSDSHAMYVDDAWLEIHGSEDVFDMAYDFRGTGGKASRFVETDTSRAVVNTAVIMRSWLGLLRLSPRRNINWSIQ